MPGYSKNKFLPHISALLPEHLGEFLCIGILSTTADISLLYLLTDLCGVAYLLSAGVSYMAGGVFSYFLNKTLNFHNESRQYVRQGMAFLVISVTSLLLNLGIIYAAVELFGINYLPAKGCATGIAFFWNFFGQRSITFRLWR